MAPHEKRFPGESAEYREARNRLLRAEAELRDPVERVADVDARANLVIVGKAPAAKLRSWADRRGWNRLRVVSSAGNSFNVDYNAEFPSEYGDQHPVMHVFVRRNGAIRHFWSSELLYTSSEGEPRHLDTTWPLWNLLDSTPEGRGSSWHPEYQL